MIASRKGDNRLHCELGPADKIALRNSQAATNVPPPEFDATEMFWLRAAPGSLVLEGRFQLKVNRGELNQITLQLDSSVHLIPPVAESAIASIQPMNDDGQVRLHFREPVAESIVFEMSFVLEPPSPTARIAWPRVGIVGAKETRRILAASSTPNIELHMPSIPGAKVLSAAEFALLWPSQNIRSRWIADVPTTQGNLEIQIAPRPATLTAGYTTVASARRTAAELNWLADVQIAGEPLLELKIHGPSSLWVEDVRVSDAANPRPSRWVRNRAGDITIVLDSPLVGEAQVRLTGSITLDSGANLAIPKLEIHDAESERQTIYLTRALNASIAVGDFAGLQQLPADEATRRWSGARSQFRAIDHDPLVAAFEGIERDSSLNLRIAPNRPQTNVVQVTTVERSDTGWTASLDAELTIAGGTIDQLRLGLPNNWTGPFSIDPPMQSQIVDSPDGARVLIIDPPAPLTATARVSVRGPLAATGGQPIRAPDIYFDGANAARDYLVLPFHHNLQQLAWEMRDLVEETLPKNFNAPTAATGAKTYLRASPRAAAELKSIEKLADNARVRLADIALAWHADGSCYGVASFDLDPAGVESCLLGLPSDFELVQLSIDEIAHPRQAVANQRWRLSLGRARLPVRVEVVFRGSLPPGDTRDAPNEALAPWLVGIPVEQTLWTVSGPRWAGLPNVNLQESLPPADAEIARLKSTAALIESAGATFIEASADEITRWYRPWLDRWRLARDSLQRLTALSLNGESAAKTTETLSRTEAEQVQLARRLGIWPDVEPIWNAPSLHASPVQTWQQSLGRHHASAHYVVDNAATAPTLEYPKAFAGDWASRVGQAAVACVIILVVGWSIRATSLLDVFTRWPHAAVIAFGLLWWLLLSPSAVGWIIVAIGAFGPRIDRAIGKYVRRRVAASAGKP
jgi:hypothetical protein